MEKSNSENILVNYFVENAIDKAVNNISEIIKDARSKVSFTKTNFEKALASELQKTIDWAQEVRLKKWNYKANINQIYVELDLFISKQRDFTSGIQIEQFKFSELLNKYRENLIIYGQPGAGKTTSLKHLCYTLLFEKKDEYFNNGVPLVIRFRDLQREVIEENLNLLLISYIYSALGIQFENMPEPLLTIQKKNIITRSVFAALNDLNILLILDGFDELMDDNKKKIVTNELKELISNLRTSRVIITTRHGELPNLFERTSSFEMCPLKDEQVVEFANKRFAKSPIKCNEFLTQLRSSTYYKAALRPLILAYLTLIFENCGKIHDQPKEVYKRIVQLLLNEWNTENTGERQSKFANFDPDHKFDFLAALAFKLTTLHHSAVFSRFQMQGAFSRICFEFGLIPKDADSVFAEIENHHGLLVQTYEDTFEFSHKSIQEYLTADYLIRSPVPKNYDFLWGIPNEVAISIALSASPSRYMYDIITKYLQNNEDKARYFYPLFCNRLLLEKPGFNASFELAYCILYMYKICSGISDKDLSKRLNTKFVDISGIEDFCKMEAFKRSFKNLLCYYNPIGDYNNRNDSEWSFVLKRLRRRQGEDTKEQCQYLVMNYRIYKSIMKNSIQESDFTNL